MLDAWKQTSHDPNDTVLESAWYAARQALPTGAPERRAAELAAAHAGTPAVSHLDALGRVFRAVADNGAEGQYISACSWARAASASCAVTSMAKPIRRRRR
ncbi:hypothetical protein WME94_48770 [Sorangium sp. So ce429]